MVDSAWCMVDHDSLDVLCTQATRGAAIHHTCRVSVGVDGVDAAVCARLAQQGGASVRRLDADHANPRRRWIELGMPQYPTSDENQQILDASEMAPEPLKVRKNSPLLSLPPPVLSIAASGCYVRSVM